MSRLTSVRTVLLLVFYVHGLHPASGQVTVAARSGGGVLLPCIIEAPPPTEKLPVFWRDHNNLIVLDIRGHRDDLSTQDLRFKGRVSGEPRLYQTGNFSILMKGVREEDSGLYECNIPKLKFKTSVTLTVSGPSDEAGPESPGLGAQSPGPGPSGGGATVTPDSCMLFCLLLFSLSRHGVLT